MRSINWQWVIIGAVAGLVIYLVIVPLGMLIFSSFRTVSPGEPGPFTFDNYIEAYSSAGTYELLFNTAKFALISVFIGIFFGVLFAWLVERTNTPLRHIGFVLIPLNTATPAMLYAIAWVLLLSPKVGLFNIALMHLFGLKEAPIQPYSILGMGLVDGLRSVSVVFLMVVGIFRRMDPALEEAAAASGATVLTTMRSVTLKLMLPGTLAAMIYCITSSFDSFEIPAVMGMPRSIFVFSSKIWRASNQVNPNYGMVSTLGVILLALAVLWVYLYNRTIRHMTAYATITGKGYRPSVIDLGRWKYLGTALIITYFLISFVAPTLILIWASLLPFYKIPSIEGLSKVSLDAYREILTSAWLLDALKNTAIVVLSASTLCAFLSTVVSWIVARTQFYGRRILDTISFLPNAIPGIVMALAFMWLYLRLTFIPIYGTIWIIMLAFTTKYLAFGTRTMNAAMVQIHKEIEEASEASGASWPTTFFSIIVPLLIPSIVTVWIWAAMHSVRELSIPVMLYSPESRVLSILIWDNWGSGNVPTTCAIGVMLMIFIAALLLIGRIVATRRAPQF